MKLKLPLLLSSKQVSELLGIPRTNMTAQRKVKGFPQPIIIIDTFPVWLESDIVTWVEWKNKFKGVVKMKITDKRIALSEVDGVFYATVVEENGDAHELAQSNNEADLHQQLKDMGVAE